MNTVNTADFKAKKNCLLVFRNKKLNNFDEVNNVVCLFAEMGYYFDKIAYVAFNMSDEIVRAIMDGKENYENLVIYCPSEMKKTLKDFLSALYSSDFNEMGVLNSKNGSVFMLFSDCVNKLNCSDIGRFLDKKYGVKYEKAYVKTIGAPADKIKNAILTAINADETKAEIVHKLMNFNVSESYGDCTIEIVYPDEIPKSTFDKVFRTLVTSLDEYLYAVENFSLAQRLFQLLQLRRMKICVAESFTGGGVGKRLVDIPGISEVYFEGLNTYSNDSKIERLGVNEYTLRQYGAVSEQVAREMADGLIKSGHCDVSIATTGIAGPKSDNTKKPVGLIYIGIGTREDVSVYRYNLSGNRDEITNTAINLALFHAFKKLK